MHEYGDGGWVVTIWVDGDSIPRDLRQLLVRRAANSARSALTLSFISTVTLSDIPPELLQLVEPGPDAADDSIESRALPGDLVVTRDIPFAERLAAKGIAVMNDRGDLFTMENIAERRSLRDAAAELRLLGMAPPSPRGSQRTPRDIKRFADALDRTLSRMKNKT